MFNVYFHGSRKEKKIALTFDDGPSKETIKILDILKNCDSKATFFLIGKRIKGREKIIKKIISEKHEIGNHTYSHKWLIFKSIKFIKEDIKKCDREFRKFGIKTNLFRFPAFKKGILPLMTVLFMGKKMIFAEVIPKEWKQPYYKTLGINLNFSWEQASDIILKKVKPGSIINLHDYLEGVGNYPEVLLILRRIVPRLKEKGFEFVTVSELLFTSAP